MDWLYKDEIVARLEKGTTKINGAYWDKIQKSNGNVGYAPRETFDYETDYKMYLVPVNTTSGDNNNSNNTLKGDVNGDGVIDAMDMYLIIQYLLGNIFWSNQVQKIADINEDLQIDAMDMYLMIQKILNSN